MQCVHSSPILKGRETYLHGILLPFKVDTFSWTFALICETCVYLGGKFPGLFYFKKYLY